MLGILKYALLTGHVAKFMKFEEHFWLRMMAEYWQNTCSTNLVNSRSQQVQLSKSLRGSKIWCFSSHSTLHTKVHFESFCSILNKNNLDCFKWASWPKTIRNLQLFSMRQVLQPLGVNWQFYASSPDEILSKDTFVHCLLLCQPGHCWSS